MSLYIKHLELKDMLDASKGLDIYSEEEINEMVEKTKAAEKDDSQQKTA